MIELIPNQAKRILCVGAHSDDIEIGLGGTLLQLLDSTPGIEVFWAVTSAPGVRGDEARRSAEAFLQKATKSRVAIGSFRESYFPSEWPRIKDWFEEIAGGFKPDVIFTHFREDRHQDHRVLSDLAWNTFRNHLVLEYEILKYDGDLGAPNLYVPLSTAAASKKIELLLTHFETQRKRHWFTQDTFEALHRIRGVECASPTGLAEAFYARKCVASFGSNPG